MRILVFSRRRKYFGDLEPFISVLNVRVILVCIRFYADEILLA